MTQYVLQLVYITPLECLRVILSVSVHDMGQLKISPSGGLVFGNSLFVTLDQSVTFVLILIRMNIRIYSYQENYSNEYLNIFV